MKKIIGITAIAMSACSSSPSSQSGNASAEPVPPAASQPAPAAAASDSGLSALASMTFACTKAGLEAAAREASKVPSQGTYQFSYFRIVTDSHHAAYEVRFKSNVQGESELRYCVAIYCQQGWDPQTTKVSVWRMEGQRQQREMAGHGSDCAGKHADAQRETKP